MDQDTAKVLFEDGAMLVLLNLPEGTEFGVDYTSWNVGPKFKGLKMIPPGVHFIYYSACNSDGQCSPRTGFFHNFSKREILIKKWDHQTEDISATPVSAEELERISANKKELDQFLGPYPYENYKTWVSLSSYMTEKLIKRLEPISGVINSVAQFISHPCDSQSRKLQMETDTPETSDSNGLPNLEEVANSRIRFTEISKPAYPQGCSPAQITQHNLDSTLTLDAVLANGDQNEEDILGEIQFAFVCFLIGQVSDAFDQWKRLVHLLCSSSLAVEKRPNLYSKFISLLFYHIKEIPEDFFVDIVSSNNFLVSTLHELFLTLEGDKVEANLQRRGLQFRKHLTKKFKWDFTEEPSDEAPVVVDLEGINS